MSTDFRKFAHCFEFVKSKLSTDFVCFLMSLFCFVRAVGYLLLFGFFQA